MQKSVPVYSYLSFWDWFACQPVWLALLWQECLLGAKVFRAKHKRGFFGVEALDVQTNFLYPDFPVCSRNLCMPVNGLEDYFTLQILQKPLAIYLKDFRPMTLSLAECQEDVLLSSVTELITDLQYEMKVLDSVSALHRTAQQSYMRLLLHNLIHYRKTCVFLSMTEFNLLEKLW